MFFMANRVVVDYIKKHKDSHSAFKIKHKLLEAGYSNGEISEGFNFLNMDENHNSSEKSKWIFISSVSGFLLSFVYVLFFSLNFFNFQYKSFLYLFFGVLGFFSSIIFYFGFYNLSKYMKSSFFRFSSMFIFVVNIFIILTGIIFSILMSLNFLTGIGIILFLPLIFGFIYLLSRVFLGIGFIRVRDKLKIMFFTGIFELILAGFIFLFLIGFSYLLLNPFFALFLDKYIFLISIFQFLFWIIGLTVIVLESFTLLLASKKFE